MTTLIYDWPKSDRLHLTIIYLRIEQQIEKGEKRLVQVFLFNNRLNSFGGCKRQTTNNPQNFFSPNGRLYVTTEVRQQMQNDLIILSM